MLLWIAFAILTAAVLAVVLAPLARPARSGAAAVDGETLNVYRHQLEELDAERARGVIDETEAGAARIEISRRLLASADRSEHVALPAAMESRHTAVALATAALLPVVTLAVYLAYGSPGLPAYPLSERAQLRPEQAQIGELVARVEARLREHPQDGKGWDVIAPVYLKLGRFRDAADAYARAAALEGETMQRLAGLAESSVLAADGIVTEAARLAYEKMLKMEPGRVEPRFWLALAKEQDGKLAPALADYKALFAEASSDAPYRSVLEQRIADVGRRLSDPGAASPRDKEPRGPSASDVAAAEKMAPEQRAQMIAGMVDGLAQRLKKDGKDLPGWLRLVNAYVVLDRKDDARAALAEARRNFVGDVKALGELSALGSSLGLGS